MIERRGTPVAAIVPVEDLVALEGNGSRGVLGLVGAFRDAKDLPSILDGVIIDVHPQPDLALCDGPQALVTEDLPGLANTISQLGAFMGRKRHAEQQRHLIAG